MKALSINVIPAQLGFYTVIDFSETRTVEVDEPVIAWRIETYNIKDSNEVFSTSIPITANGEIVDNCIGIQNPDKSVTVFEEATYKSLAKLQKSKYPSK